MVLVSLTASRPAAASRSAVVRMDFGRVGTQVDMPSLPSKMNALFAEPSFDIDLE